MADLIFSFKAKENQRFIKFLVVGSFSAAERSIDTAIHHGLSLPQDLVHLYIDTRLQVG